MIPSDYRASVILHWTNTEQFDRLPLGPDQSYDMVGWMWDKPRVGQTVCVEMQRSWVLYEFVEINPCRDPHDMFFAKVKPIEQKLK